MFEVLTGKCGKNECCVCTSNATIWRLVVVLGVYVVGKVVKVLSYKSVGRLSDPRWCHRYFLLAQIPSECTMALGSTPTLIDTSTRSTSWG